MKDASPWRATSAGSYRCISYQSEYMCMEQHTVRKTFKYKLSPTPAQQQMLERVLTRCCTLYNTAPEERKTT
jgi:hypothetical protein